MELGKHEKQSSLNKNLKEKLTLHPLQHGQQIGSKDLGVTSSLSFLNAGQVPSGDSGTKPLIFTFIPTVRRLPVHSQIVDASEFLTKIDEEPRDENIRETINRSKKFSDSLASTSGIGQESSIQTTVHYTDTSQNIFQGRRFKSSKPEAMEQSDLFKAEYVFIVDSEGEEESTSRNDNKISSHGDNHRSLRPQSLDLPKVPMWGAEVPKKPGIDIHAPPRPELPPGTANQQKTAQYKIKSSYKAFAAIPTNTLLMEQKALDEPAKKGSIPKDDVSDPHLELCSPAQLRQQTEELCATIDKVLQDSLQHLESPSSSLQTLLDSDVNKMPSTLQRSAGRETKYANLSLPMSTVGESQLTKPGVIRPAPVKSKIILRKEEEEPYEPNPFSKYLEDSSGPCAGQEAVSLHPLYQTKLFPPDKLPLPSQTIIGPHCVNPGPFSHLTAVSLSDKHENSHSSFSPKALYNKLSHPIVTIPENEALGSKEQ
ncbi:muscular LMNA-interacting protein isoform X12 [Ornithorhynchus anatinus]|uniref:muscular LMNA-interacting protein isoform X12 n=1 Tax=Ornithorhynchus anatinus TaxID=9258 RepID=UPI0010A7BA8D|nr:muscular LMNA-interacting protein isoform X12 [Ornithorhynchus anatinus]